MIKTRDRRNTQDQQWAAQQLLLLMQRWRGAPAAYIHVPDLSPKSGFLAIALPSACASLDQIEELYRRIGTRDYGLALTSDRFAVPCVLNEAEPALFERRVHEVAEWISRAFGCQTIIVRHRKGVRGLRHELGIA